jgi:hypothetical protein
MRTGLEYTVLPIGRLLLSAIFIMSGDSQNHRLVRNSRLKAELQRKHFGDWSAPCCMQVAFRRQS